MTLLTGWRYVAFISTIVGVCGAAIYPIAIAPMIDPTYYSKPEACLLRLAFDYSLVYFDYRKPSEAKQSRTEARGNSAGQ